MASVIKPGWSKPSTILFASEIPANEKAFNFALAQAKSSARISFFFTPTTRWSSPRRRPRASATTTMRLRPAQKTEILNRWHSVCAMPASAARSWCGRVGRRPDTRFPPRACVDRIVMGTHSPGPIGKLLVGSVAEAVLRTAHSRLHRRPGSGRWQYRRFATQTILCAVSLLGGSHVVAAFAAELAAPQCAPDSAACDPAAGAREVLAGRTIDQIEADLLALVPIERQD